MNYKFIKGLFIFLIFAGAGCLSPKINYNPELREDADETGMKIGVFGASDEATTPIYEEIKQGAIRAKNDINAKGMEIIATTAECDAEEIEQKIVELIEGDNIRAIIVASCVEQTLATAEFLNKNKMPSIFANTSDDVQNAGQYIFNIKGFSNYDSLGFDAIQLIHYVTKTDNYNPDYISQALLKNSLKGELGKIDFNDDGLAEIK